MNSDKLEKDIGSIKRQLWAILIVSVFGILLIITKFTPSNGGEISLAEIDSSIGELKEKRQREAKHQLQYVIRDIEKAPSDESRWMAINEATTVAANAGEYDVAESYAKQLLDLSNNFKNNWNYGNAVHDANLAIGAAAFSRGNILKAKSHLLAAGRTPASPQLKSFGPSMALAEMLLNAGEKDAVVEYIKLCQEFWEESDKTLNTWTQSIASGHIPSFVPNDEF